MVALEELRCFDGRIFADASSLQLYRSDQSEPPAFAKHLLTADPLFVAQPASIEACSRLLAYLYERRIPVVPRGVASFALGGAVPARRAVILDLSPRRRVLRLDEEQRIVSVEAGCRWSELSEYLEPYGLDIYTCPTSIFSTVAGWVSTGGAGLGTLKYGRLRGLVTEVEVVLPDGHVRRLRAGEPEFDLIFGSEGQLCVIWSVTLRVREKQRVQHPVLLPCESPEAAMVLVSDACRFAPYTITFFNRARMAVANRDHALLPESDTLLAVYETAEEAWGFQQLMAGRGIKTAPRGVASYLWNERFFPIRMKKHSPGMLAADLVMPREKLGAFLQMAEAAGRSHGVDVFCEASFDTPTTAVTLPSFFSDPRDGLRYALHGYLALAIATRGIAMGGRPYGYGLWYSHFRTDDPHAQAARAFKARVDPHRTFNPGKNLAPSFKLSLWNAFTRTTLQTSPLSLRFNAALLRLLPKRAAREREPLRTLARAIDACSSCGSCISNCPAYIETSDERTTARGKLKMAAAIMRGQGRFSIPEEKVPFLCMHCKFCTEVCQSDIPLEDVYRELEGFLAARVGWPEKEVASFVTSIESKGTMRALGLAGPSSFSSQMKVPVPRRMRDGGSP